MSRVRLAWLDSGLAGEGRQTGITSASTHGERPLPAASGKTESSGDSSPGGEDLAANGLPALSGAAALHGFTAPPGEANVVVPIATVTVGLEIGAMAVLGAADSFL